MRETKIYRSSVLNHVRRQALANKSTNEVHLKGWGFFFRNSKFGRSVCDGLVDCKLLIFVSTFIRSKMY